MLQFKNTLANLLRIQHSKVQQIDPSFPDERTIHGHDVIEGYHENTYSWQLNADNLLFTIPTTEPVVRRARWRSVHYHTCEIRIKSFIEAAVCDDPQNKEILLCQPLCN